MALSDAEQISGDPAIGKVLAELHRQNCFVVQRGQVRPAYEVPRAVSRVSVRQATAHPSRRVARCSAGPRPCWRRASETEAAAGLYRAAEDWQGLSALALREAPALIAAGRHLTLEHWLSGCRAEYTSSCPGSSTGRARRDALRSGDGAEHFRAGLCRLQIRTMWWAFIPLGRGPWKASSSNGAISLRGPLDRRVSKVCALRYPEFPPAPSELRTCGRWALCCIASPGIPAAKLVGTRLVLLDPADRDLSVLLGGYLIIWFLWRGETPKAGSVIRTDRSAGTRGRT